MFMHTISITLNVLEPTRSKMAYFFIQLVINALRGYDVLTQLQRIGISSYEFTLSLDVVKPHSFRRSS